MTKKLLLVVIGAAAIMAAVWFGVGRTSVAKVDIGQEEVASQGRPHPAAVTDSVAESAEQAGAPVATPALDRVKKLSDLATQTTNEKVERGQAITELQQAMQLCEIATVSTSNLSHSARERLKTERGRKRHDWYASFARDFCDSSSVSGDQLDSQTLRDLPSDDLWIQSGVLSEADPSKPDPALLNHAKGLGDQKRSPIALQNASEFLLERGEEIPAMRLVPPPPSLRSQEARAQAQRLAVQMVTCEVRGGCGVSGLYTFKWCGDCEPGLTMEQHWLQQYSPETVAFARAVAAKVGANP